MFTFEPRSGRQHQISGWGYWTSCDSGHRDSVHRDSGHCDSGREFGKGSMSVRFYIDLQLCPWLVTLNEVPVEVPFERGKEAGIPRAPNKTQLQ